LVGPLTHQFRPETAHVTAANCPLGWCSACRSTARKCHQAHPSAFAHLFRLSQHLSPARCPLIGVPLAYLGQWNCLGCRFLLWGLHHTHPSIRLPSPPFWTPPKANQHGQRRPKPARQSQSSQSSQTSQTSQTLHQSVFYADKTRQGPESCRLLECQEPPKLCQCMPSGNITIYTRKTQAGKIWVWGISIAKCFCLHKSSTGRAL
jgi:hypothetical protein